MVLLPLERGCHSVQILLFFFPPSAPEVSSTHRNNTNLFTRLGNVGYWRAEICRNHTERKKRGKLHQVGHGVWLHHRSISFFFLSFFLIVFLGHTSCVFETVMIGDQSELSYQRKTRWRGHYAWLNLSKLPVFPQLSHNYHHIPH